MTTPCKHLDYEGEYGPDIELRDCAPHFPAVRYWHRGPTWTDSGGPQKVQFCKLRGRINGVFQCYQPGEMYCYAPESAEAAETRGERKTDGE